MGMIPGQRKIGALSYKKIFFQNYLKISRFVEILTLRKPDTLLFLPTICPKF